MSDTIYRRKSTKLTQQERLEPNSRLIEQQLYRAFASNDDMPNPRLTIEGGTQVRASTDPGLNFDTTLQS